MCGLAGYLTLANKQEFIDESLLEKMQQAIAHRGPDGYRTWIDHERNIGLVHRRLSIVDLSENAFQPLFDSEKNIAVMCNGEIYNHKSLRAELEQLGHVFATDSDSEVIVYAYKQWGIDCLARFEGMFAIVIIDRVKDEIYCVRDRIGVKPLYFSTTNGMFSFASEIKALWELPWMNKELNPQGAYHYLTFMVTPAPLTLYKGVYKLPASYYIKIDAQRNISFHEWYCPLTEISNDEKRRIKKESYCVERIQDLLTQSIEKRMMADVPLGVFLSGGVDSSLNVGLMSQFVKQVKTFNVSFEDGPEHSEILWARKVAAKFNTDHHEIVISEKEAFEFFESMVHHQDEPLADCVCIPLYYVSKLLKETGVTVVQVGEGADELFCGYQKYADYLQDYQKYWNRYQNIVPTLAKKGLYFAASAVFPEYKNRLDTLKNWAHDRHFFWTGAFAFSEEWKQSIFIGNQTFEHDEIVEKIYPGLQQSYDSYAFVDYHLKRLYERDPEADFLKSIIYLDLKQRLPELLLMRVDKMTMATSVEARVPFLDHKLVEFALHVPSSLKYKQGQTKHVLKRAAEDILPHDIIYRKKMGFAAPTSRWFKQGRYFKPYFEAMLEQKEAEWGDVLNIESVQSIYTKNLDSKHEYALQLWVVQNLMASL